MAKVIALTSMSRHGHVAESNHGAADARRGA